MTTAVEVMPEIRIEDVRVGERARKDYGDLTTLRDSIAEHGLLQPIVLLPDNWLLCGGRRLEACRELGWASINYVRSTNRGDAISRLKAERDENTCRKDMTPSELVAIGKMLEELKRSEAEERLRSAQARGRETRWNGVGAMAPTPSPADDTHQTRREVADALGIGAASYTRAKRVVEAAENEAAPPEVRAVAQEAVAEMDAGKLSIRAADDKVKAAIAGADRAPRPVPAARPEMLRNKRRLDANRVIASTVLDASNVVSISVLAEIDYAELDRHKLGEWVSSLSESICALQALKRSLKKELSRD